MSWDASFDDVEFVTAVDWFRRRTPTTDVAHAASVARASREAFWIAGVTQSDMIKQIQDSLGRALAKGVPYEEWQAEIGPLMRRAWGGALPLDQQPFRVETIMRNWAQSSYNRARWEQMETPAVKRLRPYRMFDATRPTEWPHPTCTAWDGRILSADDPVWRTMVPPLHHRCQSGIRMLSERAAKRRGISEEHPKDVPDEGFGGLGEWEGPDSSDYPVGAKPPKPPRRPPVPEAPPAKPITPHRVRPVGRYIDGDSGSTMSARMRREIEGSLTDRERDILARHPLREVVVQDRVYFDTRPVYGVYHPARRRIELSTGLPPTEPRASALGASWGVEARAADEAAGRMVTFRHEVGHHMLSSAPASAIAEIHRAYAHARETREVVSVYASTHVEEYWAECYAAYHYWPDELKTIDPEGYAMVESVLGSL